MARATVHTLLTLVLQRLEIPEILISCWSSWSARKSLQLQMMTSLSVQYCLGQPMLLFFSFAAHTQIVVRCHNHGSNPPPPRINHFKATVTRSSQCNCDRFVCMSIVLVKQDSRPSPKCLYSTTFQSPEVLIYSVALKKWKKTMQLVSENFVFNACHVSLLWLNSFLVSLWTFQPTS